MQKESKISRQKDEQKRKEDIVNVVKTQRKYRAQSMAGSQRVKMHMAQSVKEHKRINIRKMEDTTVDCIHSLIDMKETSEINKDLRRQKYTSRDLSFNISKRLSKIGNTVQSEFMSLKDESRIDEMKQRVIDQRMTVMDAKKRSQLSIIDNFNKRQQGI